MAHSYVRRSLYTISEMNIVIGNSYLSGRKSFFAVYCNTK